MLLNGLFDDDLLLEMIHDGYIRMQTHPTLPYTIYNYTEKATFDRVWNAATLQCRGLIVHNDTDGILARPFRKFFNWGEEAGTFSLESYRNSQVTVTDKLDGSLGILYPTADGWAIATRGSFASPQALHATDKLQEYVAAGWEPPPDTTLLFEIIYPENRIVCQYYDLDDLVLLGSVSIEWGYSTGPQTIQDWPGPRTKVFGYRTFQQALDAQHRKGAEGLVVHFHQNDKRIKLKQPDYVELHRIVTGLNERRVWELMVSGHTLPEIQEPLPEEFHSWVEKVYDEIHDLWYDTWDMIEMCYQAILKRMPKDFTRKDFALEAGQSGLSGFLFRRLDGKDIGEMLWQRVKPGFTKGPWARGEDTA